MLIDDLEGLYVTKLVRAVSEELSGNKENKMDFSRS
jgi:hypothetical protein